MNSEIDPRTVWPSGDLPPPPPLAAEANEAERLGVNGHLVQRSLTVAR